MSLRFIDFCAGIGGGRLGLEKVGMECVAFSEIDKKAELTYRTFFGNKEKNHGDLMKINPTELPSFDLLIAGFPCQTFSVIGQRKGMEDSRGQVIYGITNILKSRKTPYFILENVKGLLSHNNGETLKTILSELADAGYKVYHNVISSIDYGLPQMRERIYFVGIEKQLIKKDKKFNWPTPIQPPPLDSFLIDNKQLDYIERKKSYDTFRRYLDNNYNRGQFKIEELLEEDYLVLDTRQSDLRLYRKRVPTLRTGRHGILYVKDRRFKKLSGLESLLLQGFPKELAKLANEKIADMYLLSQAGNAMSVPTIEAIAKSLLAYIKNNE